MCKVPNKSKITTFLRQCLTSTSAKADLSAIYSPSDLSVEQVELEDMRTYHVYARCNLPHGVCPYCGHVSRSVHSRYHRTIADLLILGHPVIITFEARKFFCYNPDCRKKTFSEQPGDEVFRYRRRTRRCEMAVTKHGLKCSSESARKLLSAIGVPLISNSSVVIAFPFINTFSHFGRRAAFHLPTDFKYTDLSSKNVRCSQNIMRSIEVTATEELFQDLFGDVLQHICSREGPQG